MLFFSSHFAMPRGKNYCLFVTPSIQLSTDLPYEHCVLFVLRTWSLQNCNKFVYPHFSYSHLCSACAFLVVFPLITWLENWSVHLSGNNKDCSAGVLFSVVVLLSTSLNGASRLHNASHCGRVTPTLAWVRIIKFYSAYL